MTERYEAEAFSSEGLRVEMRAAGLFCRREWEAWLSGMVQASLEAGMLPGQDCGPRASEEYRDDPSVELILVNDGEIAEVNARHLGCSGPTNILSFPGENGRLGSMMLSVETLMRESVLYGQDPEEHARRLLAHGMGHLIGFDHSPEMEDFCLWLESVCTHIEA